MTTAGAIFLVFTLLAILAASKENEEPEQQEIFIVQKINTGPNQQQGVSVIEYQKETPQQSGTSAFEVLVIFVIVIIILMVWANGI